MLLSSILFVKLKVYALNGGLGGTWGSCFCIPTTITLNERRKGTKLLQGNSLPTVKNTLPEVLCHTVVRTSAWSTPYLKGYWARLFLCHYRMPFQRPLQGKAFEKHHSSSYLPTWIVLWLYKRHLKYWWWHVHISGMFEKRGLLVTLGDPAVLEEMLPPSITEAMVLSLRRNGTLLEEAEMHWLALQVWDEQIWSALDAGSLLLPSQHPDEV